MGQLAWIDDFALFWISLQRLSKPQQLEEATFIDHTVFMKLNNILMYSKNTVYKPMYTSGRHDYRGVRVEKKEGRQKGILPNLSGSNPFNGFGTGTDWTTCFNQYPVWLLELNITRTSRTKQELNWTGLWQHYLSMKKCQLMGFQQKRKWCGNLSRHKCQLTDFCKKGRCVGATSKFCHKLFISLFTEFSAPCGMD